MALPGICGGSGGCCDFAVQVIGSRWFMVFGAILIMSATGAQYMFGSYSADIKDSLGYDQSTLNLLSFSKDLGANVGIIAGLINEVTPPWVVLFIGAALNSFGYIMVWLAVTKKITVPAVWHMCLYIAIGANSQSFANTGALVTVVKNFPESRGAVLGLLKGYIGISGAVITQLFHAVYDNDTKSLILMIAWLPAAVYTVFLPTIRIMTPARVSHELNVFYKILYMSLGLAGFLMIIIILEKQLNFSLAEYDISAAVMLSLLCLPVVIVIQEEVNKNRDRRAEESAMGNLPTLHVITENPISETIITDETESERRKPSCWRTVFQPPARGEDFTILQALFSIDMFILFLATICGVGGTLTAIDNLGQIGISLGYPKKTIHTFVSLVSIWNYLGRVTAGFGSEYLLKEYKFPRTFMLTITLTVSCIGHLLIAFGVPNGLYFASVIIGFCFGAQWPLLFAIISELFGLRYYSTLYNFGSIASPIGSYILNVIVAGHLYDMEAKKQLRASGLKQVDGKNLNCDGVVCFKVAFLIITGATFLGALISVLLVLRTRKFYKSDIYKKFREAVDLEMAMTPTSAGRSGTPVAL